VRPVDQAAAMLVADPICWNVFPAKVLMAPAVRRRWMDGAADPPRNWICPARTVSFRHWCLLTARPAYRAVTLFLRDLAVNDMSSLTCRGYAFDLLRWFRFLWESTSGGHQSWSDLGRQLACRQGQPAEHSTTRGECPVPVRATWGSDRGRRGRISRRCYG